ncbi:hypothetical protein POF50_004040 [Streptomyces sp. SL13]|uniref:Uncharacterized protein n=1 Tax=Streptantibioticus silvisoli TaxID=2705255 RepID=A0AA90GUX7_9ACTN|nr:hypothetical protein [Streptantibioticus silvisoli]MDI5968523.1 hypothetical protein [Streptantibioticus silvisoli]
MTDGLPREVPGPARRTTAVRRKGLRRTEPPSAIRRTFEFCRSATEQGLDEAEINGISNNSASADGDPPGFRAGDAVPAEELPEDDRRGRILRRMADGVCRAPPASAAAAAPAVVDDPHRRRERQD